eukprot:759465-Hanusia_phi.AAC.1
MELDRVAVIASGNVSRLEETSSPQLTVLSPSSPPRILTFCFSLVAFRWMWRNFPQTIEDCYGSTGYVFLSSAPPLSHPPLVFPLPFCPFFHLPHSFPPIPGNSHGQQTCSAQNPQMRSVGHRETSETSFVSSFFRFSLSSSSSCLDLNPLLVLILSSHYSTAMPSQVRQVLELVPRWVNVAVEDALEMLGESYRHAAIRSLAVRSLGEVPVGGGGTRRG